MISLISGQGISHFLRTHKTQHTQPRGWKKREETWTSVNSKRKKEEVRDTFVLLSVHLQAIASVYSSEIPTKSPGMLTHLLTLANPASGSIHPSSRLLSPTDCLVLSTSLFLLLLCSPWDLPSIVLF